MMVPDGEHNPSSKQKKKVQQRVYKTYILCDRDAEVLHVQNDRLALHWDLRVLHQLRQVFLGDACQTDNKQLKSYKNGLVWKAYLRALQPLQTFSLENEFYHREIISSQNNP